VTYYPEHKDHTGDHFSIPCWWRDWSNYAISLVFSKTTAQCKSWHRPNLHIPRCGQRLRNTIQSSGMALPASYQSVTQDLGTRPSSTVFVLSRSESCIFRRDTWLLHFFHATAARLRMSDISIYLLPASSQLVSGRSSRTAVPPQRIEYDQGCLLNHVG